MDSKYSMHGKESHGCLESFFLIPTVAGVAVAVQWVFTQKKKKTFISNFSCMFLIPKNVFQLEF